MQNFRTVLIEHIGKYQIVLKRSGKNGVFRIVSYSEIANHPNMVETISCLNAGRKQSEAQIIYRAEYNRLASLSNIGK